MGLSFGTWMRTFGGSGSSGRHCRSSLSTSAAVLYVVASLFHQHTRTRVRRVPYKSRKLRPKGSSISNPLVSASAALNSDASGESLSAGAEPVEDCHWHRDPKWRVLRSSHRRAECAFPLRLPPPVFSPHRHRDRTCG